MIYFTSDWHIGHDKTFLYGKRGFQDIYTHDTMILKNCNAIVKPEDELYILGDLALGNDESEWNRIFYNLNCNHIHFIQGNHDTDTKVDKYTDKYLFEYHGYVDIIKYSKNKRFYLSHFPTVTDNYDNEKRLHIINLYGHTHQMTNFFNHNPYMYHVGVDSHNMTPVSIEQIIKDIKKEVEKHEE